MNKNFIYCKSVTDRFEGKGKYTNNQNDQGKETFNGISRVSFPNWIGWNVIDQLKSHPDFPAVLQDSQLLEEYVTQFYLLNIWVKLHLDSFPLAIALVIYDSAVHHGKFLATEWLQTALNVLNREQMIYDDIEVDGKLGGITEKAVQAASQNISNPNLIAELVLTQRGQRFINVTLGRETNETFITGWFNRISQLRLILNEISLELKPSKQ